VLLVVAALLLRSLQNSAAFDPGFKTENLLLAEVDLRRQGYSKEQGQAFYGQLTERLKALPNVRAVTSALLVPLGTGRETRGYLIPGQVPPNGDSTFSIANNTVGPDYFLTMGIPLVRGRDFDARDAKPGAQLAAVINETMARRFWPNAEAVGQHIQSMTNGPMIEIIGVARDIKYYSLAEEARPYVYTSAAQVYTPGITMHVRAAGDPRALIRGVQKEIESLDPNVAITNLVTFEESRRVPLFPGRAMALVTGLFGLLALLLAAVGFYGVTSHMVGQRTREVGIRMALGAQRSDILQLIVGQGVRITLIGIGIGVAAALALTRFLSSLLFGVSATDPLTFALVAVSLALLALVACWIPARRATKVDPIIALRCE